MEIWLEGKSMVRKRTQTREIRKCQLKNLGASQGVDWGCCQNRINCHISNIKSLLNWSVLPRLRWTRTGLLNELHWTATFRWKLILCFMLLSCFIGQSKAFFAVWGLVKRRHKKKPTPKYGQDEGFHHSNLVFNKTLAVPQAFCLHARLLWCSNL